jgi:hypothetical protein
MQRHRFAIATAAMAVTVLMAPHSVEARIDDGEDSPSHEPAPTTSCDPAFDVCLDPGDTSEPSEPVPVPDPLIDEPTPRQPDPWVPAPEPVPEPEPWGAEPEPWQPAPAPVPEPQPWEPEPWAPAPEPAPVPMPESPSPSIPGCDLLLEPCPDPGEIEPRPAAEPVPAEPAPNEPAPDEPEPTAPEPVEPTPLEPGPEPIETPVTPMPDPLPAPDPLPLPDPQPTPDPCSRPDDALTPQAVIVVPAEPCSPAPCSAAGAGRDGAGTEWHGGYLRPQAVVVEPRDPCEGEDPCIEAELVGEPLPAECQPCGTPPEMATPDTFLWLRAVPRTQQLGASSNCTGNTPSLTIDCTKDKWKNRPPCSTTPGVKRFERSNYNTVFGPWSPPTKQAVLGATGSVTVKFDGRQTLTVTAGGTVRLIELGGEVQIQAGWEVGATISGNLCISRTVQTRTVTKSWDEVQVLWNGERRGPTRRSSEPTLEKVTHDSRVYTTPAGQSC